MINSARPAGWRLRARLVLVAVATDRGYRDSGWRARTGIRAAMCWSTRICSRVRCRSLGPAAGRAGSHAEGGRAGGLSGPGGDHRQPVRSGRGHRAVAPAARRTPASWDYELSLAYKQRLLVVMPNGFGFNWPGHSAGVRVPRPGRDLDPTGRGRTVHGHRGGYRQVGSRQRREAPLGHAIGRRVAASPTASAGANSQPPGQAKRTPTRCSASSHWPWWRSPASRSRSGGLARRRGWPRPRLSVRCVSKLPSIGPAGDPGRRCAAVALVAGLVDRRAVACAGSVADGRAGRESRYWIRARRCSGRLPISRCPTSSGRSVSLHSFRGKVVILAFNDSECTTVCPLTTTAMLDAKAMLGKAGSQVRAARRRCQSRGDLARGRVVLFRAPRDAPLVAVPDRLPAAAQAGLEATTGSRRRSRPARSPTHRPCS